ncbi:MAG: MFS transporter [Alphaproteobacteria bacterium]|nr:MFS transporter [Alphaproteobacteria bacterium]MBP9776301.1 MFS transporter [Alphaproteobacteria bacterium]
MSKIKTISAAMAGTALEFYDITLYGFFSSLLAPLFFPSLDSTTSLMASLGAFAAGFLMRPLGGIFFGYVGDKYGRKKALVIAILLVTLPTVTIGLVPTYVEIGVFAPLTIIFCRLLQGFCVGGEYSGAAVFIAEQVQKKRGGFAGSILCATAFLGAIVGSGLGALCTAPFMPSWGWRIPFLMGGVFGLIAYFFRRQIKETTPFSLVQRKTLKAKFPLGQVFKQRKLSFICTTAIGASVQIPFYIASIYMQILLTTKLMISPSYALVMNTSIMGLWMILLPLAGLLSDRFGSIKLMSYSALSVVIIVYPLFFLLEYHLCLETILFAQIVISIAGVGFMGAAPGLMPQLFPVEERVSGTAVGFSLGQALFSGITPLMATALVTWTGDFKAPAFYLILTSLMGLLAVNGARSLVGGTQARTYADLKQSNLAT